MRESGLSIEQWLAGRKLQPDDARPLSVMPVPVRRGPRHVSPRMLRLPLKTYVMPRAFHLTPAGRYPAHTMPMDTVYYASLSPVDRHQPPPAVDRVCTGKLQYCNASGEGAGRAS